MKNGAMATLSARVNISTWDRSMVFVSQINMATSGKIGFEFVKYFIMIGYCCIYTQNTLSYVLCLLIHECKASIS